jgi:hypothetical protein
VLVIPEHDRRVLALLQDTIDCGERAWQKQATSIKITAIRLIGNAAPFYPAELTGGSTHSMALSSRTKVVPLRDSSIANSPADDMHAGVDGSARHLDEPRRFPLVTTLPRLPLMIPDEILDYYGWVFCQGGFLNLHMTFEQFLAVVAAVSPSGLCPEYEDSSSIKLGS